ncbi:MAG: efflux RND transporter periplasmic adaptor subunit [Burkholderiales bacterium]
MFATSRDIALRLALPCLLLTACGDKGSPAGTPPPAMPVSAATVIQKEISEWDEFTGKLEAVERVAIRPRVSGSMDKVYFQEGKEVKQGELLFQIDPRPFEAELQRAQADASRAQAQLELAKAQLERSEELVKSGFISRQGLDEKINAQREAAANLRAAQATIATAKLNVGYTRIHAPIPGRIGRAEVTEGNLVSGGGAGEATLLTNIVSLDPIYAYFEADEQIYLKYGQLARDNKDAGTRPARNTVLMGLSNEEGFPHEGYLDFVDNQLNTASGTMRARAVFGNKERLFTPGLFARLKLVGSGTSQAILINDRAVGTDQSKKFVLLIGPGDTLAYREVKLGPVVDRLRVVRSGLKAGDKIVVNGLQRVRPGMPVAPQMVPMENAGNPAAPAAPAEKP